MTEQDFEKMFNKSYNLHTMYTVKSDNTKIMDRKFAQLS